MGIVSSVKMIGRAAVVLVLSASVAWAGTGIMLVGEDGTIVCGRTVEWGPFDLQLALEILPRGYVYSAGEMPDGSQGATWAGRYGVVGISMMGHSTPGDGINEVGLTAGLFYLPGFTENQPYDPELAEESIAGIHTVE